MPLDQKGESYMPLDYKGVQKNPICPWTKREILYAPGSLGTYWQKLKLMGRLAELLAWPALDDCASHPCNLLAKRQA